MQLKDARAPHSGARQGGFMLVEVLVSIALSALALLALASVSAAALRYTKMSQYRATASVLANDMGERMRANKAGFVAQAYDFSSASFAAQAAGPVLPAQLCASACTASEIAAVDLAQWRLQAHSVLPQGAVYILSQPDVVAADLWLAWRDPLLARPDEAPVLGNECPAGLQAGADNSIRCTYFRIKL
jgi:type IV pilus assembly protein PilV